MLFDSLENQSSVVSQCCKAPEDEYFNLLLYLQVYLLLVLSSADFSLVYFEATLFAASKFEPVTPSWWIETFPLLEGTSLSVGMFFGFKLSFADSLLAFTSIISMFLHANLLKVSVLELYFVNSKLLDFIILCFFLNSAWLTKDTKAKINDWDYTK